MKEQRTTLYFIMLIILVLGILAGLTWANYRFSIQNPGGNDFLARWMGARYWVVDGISPYDERVSLASQEKIYGHPADITKGEDKNHFVYPIYSMIFFAPFGPLEYPIARALWMTLTEVSLFLLAIASVRFVDWNVSPFKMAVLILFTMLWYHGIRTVILGQFAGINSLLITVALLLILRKVDFMGGMLLAVTTAKPQMVFLLIPFVLLWAVSTRRRDVLGGFLVGMLVLMVASLLLLPSWPLQWLQQLIDYPSYTSQTGSPISVIANYMPGISRQLNIFLSVLALGYLILEWIFAWGKDENWFRWTAMLTVVITNLVAYRTATTNFLMMMPALFLIFSLWEQRWNTAGRFAVWVSMLLLFFGPWALFMATVQGNQEQTVMYLVFPIFCLIGLWWVRWQAIHPRRVLLKDIAKRVEV